MQTVFGELVPIPCPSDVDVVRQVLGQFIQTHLLSNSQLEEAYALSGPNGGFKQGSSKRSCACHNNTDSIAIDGWDMSTCVTHYEMFIENTV